MRINLLGSGFTGRSLAATAQTRTNIYLDVPPPGSDDKAPVVGYLMPGLDPWYSNAALTTVVGLHWWFEADSLMLIASLSAGGFGIVGVSPSGGTGVTSHTITASGSIRPVCASYGNHMLVATGAAQANGNSVAFYRSGSSQPYTLSSQNTPLDGSSYFSTAPAKWCAYLAGRFILPWDEYAGRFCWSAINDAQTWGAADFATAESNSDPLQYGIVWRGALVLFGTRTTEFWQPTGDLTAPYQLISGSVGQFGCVDTNSVQLLGDNLLFVGVMAGGGRSVCRMEGYQAVPISLPDIDYLLTQSGAAFSATAYRVSGHDFYELTIYVNATATTFCYDLTSGVWSLRANPDVAVSQIRCASPFVDSTGAPVVVAGTDNVPLCRIDPTVYTEPDSGLNNVAIPWEIVLPHVFDRDELCKLRAPMLRLDMEGGAITDPGEGDKPTVNLHISRDGGKTYGAPITRHFSSDAHPTHRPEWRRLGLGRSLTFKLSGQNDCRTVFLNAFLVDMDKANK